MHVYDTGALLLAANKLINYSTTITTLLANGQWKHQKLDEQDY